ncbi:hypothetical protein M8J77_009071 [Diaphorina citri]|nr:hypothetical protein M8J77_009071 [Diaphorina citri]
MSSPSAGNRRMNIDVIKLIESKHEMYATPDKLEASESKPNPFLSFLPILNPIPTLARFYPILAKFTSMACLRLALLRKVREAMFTHNVYYLEVCRASGLDKSNEAPSRVSTI